MQLWPVSLAPGCDREGVVEVAESEALEPGPPGLVPALLPVALWPYASVSLSLSLPPCL